MSVYIYIYVGCLHMQVDAVRFFIVTLSAYVFDCLLSVQRTRYVWSRMRMSSSSFMYKCRGQILCSGDVGRRIQLCNESV